MEDILKALGWRYAVKVFDPAKKVANEDLKTILESGRLAPSSLGIEPWKFILVENKELREKLRAASYGQPKVTDASHLIVIARRTDARESMVSELMDRTMAIQHVDMTALEGYKASVSGTIAGKDDAALDAWIRSQAYIPLGMMIETAALLNVDACPMEGFDPSQVDAILGLSEKHLTATTMFAVGYRGVDAAASRPKVRRSFEDAVLVIS